MTYTMTIEERERLNKANKELERIATMLHMKISLALRKDIPRLHEFVAEWGATRDVLGEIEVGQRWGAELDICKE